MKIRTKLILFVAASALVPAVITTAFFYQNFYGYFVDHIIENRQSDISYAEYALENYVNQVSIILEAIESDSRLQMIMSAADDEITEAAEGEREELQVVFQLFQASVEAHLDEANISAIRIYSSRPYEEMNLLCESGDQGAFASMDLIEYTYWKGILDISGEQFGIFSGYYLNDYERSNLGSMSCVQKYEYSNGNEIETAYIVVYFDSTYVSELVEKSAVYEEEMYYLLDERNTLITLSENLTDQLSIYMLDYEIIEEEISKADTFVSMETGAQTSYVAYYNITGTDWRLIYIIPSEAILGESRLLLRNFLLFYIVFLVVIGAAEVFISGNMVKRIHILTRQMKKAETGSLEELPGNPGRDEIGEMTQAYNYMTRMINDLHASEMKSLEEKNRMEVELLRAQMDPHFLYNTLDMIRWMSKNGEQEQVEEAVRTLSRFYRLTTNKGRDRILVKDELEHLELYVKLMNMRLGSKIDLSIDVDEEIMDEQIPAMIFQPIVENAIIHGILEKENQTGQVLITGWEEDGVLYFHIYDDGVGMDEDGIAQLLSENSKSRSGIGIYNTNRRLKLIYGEDEAGITYSSSPGEYTEVEIRIPKGSVQV